jgi:hypothetical protein
MNKNDKYIVLNWFNFNLLLDILSRIYGSREQKFSKIFEVQDLEIKSILKKEINRKVKKMIKEVKLKRVLLNEKKKKDYKKEA